MRRVNFVTTTLRLIACSVALLPTFALGAEKAKSPDDTVYLFTSFRGNGEDGLRFLWSEDGYKWSEVPGTFLKPRAGDSQLMRDPCLLRGPDGTYHLV
jgi:hypothetical protein